MRGKDQIKLFNEDTGKFIYALPAAQQEIYISKRLRDIDRYHFYLAALLQ
jgi:hypothetical protein